MNFDPIIKLRKKEINPTKPISAAAYRELKVKKNIKKLARDEKTADFCDLCCPHFCLLFSSRSD